MPAFRYIAHDPQGTPQNGVLTVGSVAMLTSELRSRGLLIVDVEPLEDVKKQASSQWSFWSWLPATSFDVEIGFQQLSSMLRSGLSLLSSLKTVGEHARRPKASKVWEDVCERIEEGSNLSDALAAHPKVFNDHVVQLIRVGEHSGNLDSALTSSADHLERTRNLKLLVMNALTYPVIVLVLAIGVAAYMVLSVIPKIKKFLGGTGHSLPGATQMLVDIANAVQAWLPYLCVGLVAGIIALIFIYRWPPGRLFIDQFLLKLPIVGGILRLSGTATVARGLSILLESGVTLLDSLSTVEKLVKNRVQSNHIAAARQAVLRGETLADSISASRDFRPMLGRMTAVGESAGTLAPVLTEVARFHENQLVQAIRRMSVMIEPVVIIVVGTIVGFVYYAFFTALFSLSGGVR